MKGEQEDQELLELLREKEKQDPEVRDLLFELLRMPDPTKMIIRVLREGSSEEKDRPEEEASGYGRSWSEEQKRSLEERRAEHLRGEGRSYSWDEAKSVIRGEREL